MKFLFSFLTISFCFIEQSKGQNLVPNPSFESYSVCPFATQQMDRVNDWNKLLGHDGSPDYHNGCDPAGSISVPYGAWGYQPAHSGQAYVGLSVGNKFDSYREYIYAQLTSPMIAGTTYEVSFWANLANISVFATESIHVRFTETAINWSGGNGSGPIGGPHSPHITNTVIINDTSSWQQITGTYVAVGGEQFITVGNFKNKKGSNLHLVNSSGFDGNSFIFVDDFVVQPQVVLSTEDKIILNARSNNNKEEINLDWNNAVEFLAEKYIIERKDEGDKSDFQQIAEISNSDNGQQGGNTNYSDETIERNKNYTYRIKAVNGDFLVKYSNTSSAITSGIGIEVSPNPIKDVFTLKVNSEVEESIQIRIFDILGKEVLMQKAPVLFGINEVSIKTDQISKGSYILTVSNGKGILLTDKIIKK